MDKPPTKTGVYFMGAEILLGHCEQDSPGTAETRAKILKDRLEAEEKARRERDERHADQVIAEFMRITGVGDQSGWSRLRRIIGLG